MGTLRLGPWRAGPCVSSLWPHLVLSPRLRAGQLPGHPVKDPKKGTLHAPVLCGSSHPAQPLWEQLRLQGLSAGESHCRPDDRTRPAARGWEQGPGLWVSDLDPSPRPPRLWSTAPGSSWAFPGPGPVVQMQCHPSPPFVVHMRSHKCPGVEGAAPGRVRASCSPRPTPLACPPAAPQTCTRWPPC